MIFLWLGFTVYPQPCKTGHAISRRVGLLLGGNLTVQEIKLQN